MNTATSLACATHVEHRSNSKSSYSYNVDLKIRLNLVVALLYPGLDPVENL
jgi:hypothetical protein